MEGRTRASQGTSGGMMVDGKRRETHGKRWVEAKSEACIYEVKYQPNMIIPAVGKARLLRQAEFEAGPEGTVAAMLSLSHS